MTLRIQCPACDRQFKVSEELKGRTVECGACEHRFKLGESVQVARKGKFYPGEHKKSAVEGFSRSQGATGAPVAFETAAYNQTASVADLVPMTPQQWVSTALGSCVLLFSVLLFVFGTQPNGVLLDMEVGKRVILGAFMVVVGVALVLYGCHHRRKTGLSIAAVGLVSSMALAILMPVPRTVQVPGANPNGAVAPPVVTEKDPREKEAPKTSAQVMEMVGYMPIQRAIAGHTASDVDGSQFVTAIWVPVMEERFKFQILKYLHRKTKGKERPSFYRRKNGALFVIDGPEVSMERVAALVERFGRVEEIYTDIRIIEVAVEGKRLLEASTELSAKLMNPDHPAFYVHNMNELEHIDLDRVAAAVGRLAGVEPLRFQVQISRRLVELLEEEDDTQFRGDVCRALKVWSQEGDGADEVVARVAKDVLGRGESMPRSMLDFMVSRQSSEAVPIVEVLWMEDPSGWEPIVSEIGSAAEDAVIKHLSDAAPGVQQSAVRLLRRIGTKKSIEPLKALLPGADDEMKILIQEVIDNL